MLRTLLPALLLVTALPMASAAECGTVDAGCTDSQSRVGYCVLFAAVVCVPDPTPASDCAVVDVDCHDPNSRVPHCMVFAVVACVPYP